MSRNSKLYDAWQDRRRADAEIAALGLGDLEETAFGHASLRDLAQMPEEQVARMHWMAGLFGAEDRLVHDAEFQRDVGLACARCGQTARCHSEFADPAGLTPAEAASFCPNSGAYRRAAGAGD